jgi:hypothetical protein
MKRSFMALMAVIGLGALLPGCVTHHYVNTAPPVAYNPPVVVQSSGYPIWIGQYGYDYQHRPLDQFGYPVDPYTGSRVGRVVITRVYYPSARGSWTTSRPVNYSTTYSTYRPSFTGSGNRSPARMNGSNLGTNSTRPVNVTPANGSSFNRTGGFNTGNTPAQPVTRPGGNTFNRSGGTPGTPVTAPAQPKTGSSFGGGTPSTGGSFGTQPKTGSSFGGGRK